MNNTIQYKGYVGSIEFSEEDKIFYGKVLGIRSLISYEGENATELIDDFQVDGVVDLVLQACHTYNVETALIKKLVKDKKGIPYTVVETDYSQADIEQINTCLLYTSPSPRDA